MIQEAVLVNVVVKEISVILIVTVVVECVITNIAVQADKHGFQKLVVNLLQQSYASQAILRNYLVRVVGTVAIKGIDAEVMDLFGSF